MEDLKFYLDYSESETTTLAAKIRAYLEEHGTYEPEGIIIGYWEEAYTCSPQSIIDCILENKAKFPNLKRVHLGDMESEECEISWINHTDTAPLLNELKLEELIIQGAEGLRLQNAKNDTLKKLTIISGGMSSALLQDIVQARLPNLEHLELYLGVDNYGFDGSISTLIPFMQRSNFLKVKYLGLKNSEIQNEICEKILASDILPGLEVLDLSLGTLSNTGAELILGNIDKLKHLAILDLTHNYVAAELLAKLEQAFSRYNVKLIINNDDVYYDEDDEWRSAYITE